MENSGTRKFREYQFFMEFKKKNSRKFQDFFFRGQKVPGFLAPLNSRIENSVTEFPRIFFAIYGLFWAKRRQNPAFLGPDPRIPKWGHFPISSVVTSNLHETTFCCFEKISFKVYYRKQKGKLDILPFPVVLVQSKLDISTKNHAIMLE